jgi:hypothetical protein
MAQDRTTSQEIIFFGFGFAIIAIVLAAVVNWLYPLSYERELARRPMGVWLVGYSLSILVLSMLVIVASQLWFKRLHDRPVLAAFCAGATTFLAILLYSVAVLKMLPSGLGFELVDVMNAKFFAEWQFLKFVGIIAPTCALLSAGLTWIKSYHLQSP